MARRDGTSSRILRGDRGCALVAGLVGLALVAAACGGDDSGSAKSTTSTSTEAPATTSTAVPPINGASRDPGAHPEIFATLARLDGKPLFGCSVDGRMVGITHKPPKADGTENYDLEFSDRPTADHPTLHGQHVLELAFPEHQKVTVTIDDRAVDYRTDFDPSSFGIGAPPQEIAPGIHPFALQTYMGYNAAPIDPNDYWELTHIDPGEYGQGSFGISSENIPAGTVFTQAKVAVGIPSGKDPSMISGGYSAYVSATHNFEPDDSVDTVSTLDFYVDASNTCAQFFPKGLGADA